MTLYRYTYQGEGIYQAFNQVSGGELWKIKSTWLPTPPVYEDERFEPQAWFTEKGNFMFQELVLPIIEEYGITPNVEVTQFMPGTPIYIDEYQVVIDLSKRHMLRVRN